MIGTRLGARWSEGTPAAVAPAANDGGNDQVWCVQAQVASSVTIPPSSIFAVDSRSVARLDYGTGSHVDRVGASRTRG